MSQQAQNDFYKDEEEMALDYAAAVNEEIKDLFAAGADVVQIDEPYMQARPEKARQFGLKALNAALDGVTGTTAVHICFGYAAIVHERPEGYSFLPELADSPVQQISIETAQSKLDCSVLEKLPGKTIILGVLDLSTERRDAGDGRRAHPPRAAACSPARLDHRAPDCGLKYLPRDVAFGKMSAMVDGAKIVRRELAKGVIDCRELSVWGILLHADRPRCARRVHGRQTETGGIACSTSFRSSNSMAWWSFSSMSCSPRAACHCQLSRH